jgi:transcriptional regulator with XRE-family HTH domain
MIRLEEKYEQAVQFRKRGFTYSEIAKIVDVSKSTVSVWLSKRAFSKKVKEDNLKRAAKDNVKRIGLINKARKAERASRYKEAAHSAETEYGHYKKDTLFIAGLMIYVGEGDNKDKRLIRMSNARMDLHLIFIQFLIAYLGVEKQKIRFWLLLYPDLNEVLCLKRWSKYLGVPVSQFYKNQVIEGRSKKRTLHNGVGNIIIGNTVLKLKLNKWIELATKELQK